MDDIVNNLKSDLELLKTKDGQKVLAEKYIKEKEVLTLTKQLFKDEGRNFDEELNDLYAFINTS